MAGISNTTSGRENDHDPIRIPIGENAEKVQDLAAEIKGRYETEGVTNPSAEEKLTIQDGIKFADVGVTLSPENQERLSEIKEKLEIEKNDQIKAAIAESIGNFAIKFMLNGGISFGSMLSMATSNSLDNKIESIENSMSSRIDMAAKAIREEEVLEKFGGASLEEIQTAHGELKETISEFNSYLKDCDKFDTLQIRDESGSISERIVGEFGDCERDTLLEHKEEILDMFKSDLQAAKDEAREFGKEHKGADNEPEKKEELRENIRHEEREFNQVENFYKSYDELMQKTSFENIPEIIRETFNIESKESFIEHRDEIVNTLKQDNDMYIQAEKVMTAQEHFGSYTPEQLEERYLELKDEVKGLERIRNDDPATFNSDMKDVLNIYKQEMREMECVYRHNCLENSDELGDDAFIGLGHSDDKSSGSTLNFDFFSNHNNNFGGQDMAGIA